MTLAPSSSRHRRALRRTASTHVRARSLSTGGLQSEDSFARKRESVVYLREKRGRASSVVVTPQIDFFAAEQ